MKQEMWMDGYPFIEDEWGNITGAGHQDKQTFVDEVNRYDEETSGEVYAEDERWTADCVSHQWVLFEEESDTLFSVYQGEPVTSETRGAIAVTTLWGQR